MINKNELITITTAQELIVLIKEGEQINYNKLNHLKFKMTELDVEEIIEELGYKNRRFMAFVNKFVKLSDSFIIKYKDLIDVSLIFARQNNLSIETIEILYNEFPSKWAFRLKEITKEFVEKNLDKNDRGCIRILSGNQNCNLEIIECIADNKYTDWFQISLREDLTIEFIKKYFDKLNLGALLINHRDKLESLNIDNKELEFYERLLKECKNIKRYSQQLFVDEELSGRRDSFKSEYNCFKFNCKYRKITDILIIKYLDSFDKEQLQNILDYQIIKDETIKIVKNKLEELS